VGTHAQAVVVVVVVVVVVANKTYSQSLAHLLSLHPTNSYHHPCRFHLRSSRIR
jgi:hypothetical protein